MIHGMLYGILGAFVIMLALEVVIAPLFTNINSEYAEERRSQNKGCISFLTICVMLIVGLIVLLEVTL